MSLKVGTEAAAGIVTPATGLATVFVDSADKLLKSKDDAGVVTNYGSAGVAVTSLTGEVTGTGPGATATTVTNSAVLGKVLTGLTPTSAAIAATDTILEAFNKLGNINIPIIVRLQGTNAEEAKKLIDESGLKVQSAILLSEAADLVKKAVA